MDGDRWRADPDGVDQHGDGLSAMSEIGENGANEANCEEGTSIVEGHASLQVTANSDAFPGLDKGGGRAPEQQAGPGN